jgi:hypothetical protein
VLNCLQPKITPPRRATAAFFFFPSSQPPPPHALGTSCLVGCSATRPSLFFNKVKIYKVDSNPHHFHSYFLINVIELPYYLYTTFRQRYLLRLNQSLPQCTPNLHE